MEWLVLASLALFAAALIAASQPPAHPRGAEASTATERYTRLLRELHDLDADLDTGRITPAERAEARRALAPELREAAAALQAEGASVQRVRAELQS